MCKSAILLVAVAVCPGWARAGVISVPLGSSLPPLQFAGHELRPAPLDRAPLFDAVDQIPLALGLEARVSTPLTHRRIGAGWAEWSHGYRGDVYTTDGAASIELIPAPGVRAIALYIDALPFARLHIDAGLEDGPAASQVAADGTGPVGFLFFTTDDEDLPPIRIECGDEFAIGQVFAAVPAPASFAPVALGLTRLTRRARPR